MTDEPTEEQTAATAVVIGRGVAEAMRSENFPALRAWVEREVLDLPGSPAEADERGWRAAANAIATTIWNASPLPSNGYRARPLPPPGRNDPCPCGSGRKFKRCCGQVAPEFPAFPEEEAWSLLTPHLTDDELRRFTDDPELPPGPLARLALEMKDRGLAEAARAALVRRLEGGRSLDARDEPALEVFLDLEAEARDDEDFVAWASALAGRLPRPLEVVPCRHLLLWAVSSRQIDEAHALLGRMRASNPEDPTLAPLEVMTLLAAGDTARAAARARFWLPWLERRGLAEEMPEAVELLERAARDPAEAAREFRETEIPFLGELARLVGKAVERPVRPYLMGKGEPDAVFDHPPPGVSKAEDAWGRAWPGEKPELVALDADLPVEVQEEPEPWLAVLRKHPAAFDSLDVLDDLVLFTGPVTEDFDPSWGKTLLDPLLERAAAIVETSMAAAPSVEGAPWGYLDNRPPLRLLSRLAYRLAERGRAGEAAELFEQMLRWNPNDNHGHREWLVNHFLRIGDDEHALAVTDRYPDDMLVDTLFGRALALWRLGRKGEAEKALAEAGADRPLVVQALLAEELPEPDFDPAFITLGGEAEAWLYRERMRETWQATPGALEHLRGLPRPGRRKRRRRRP